jgi:molecular chaperone DnaK
MSKDDIEKAVKDAEANAEEDKKRKELVDTKNMADSSIFGIEKLVRENGEKLSEDEKKTLTAACEKLKKELADDNDIDSVKRKMEDFTKATQPIIIKLYSASGAGNPNGDSNGGSGGADEVVHDGK